MMLYRVNAGMLPSDSWIQRDEGGGRILGEVCHFVDSLTYLCGSLPTEVQAASAGGQSDAVSAILRFADGSVGTIVYSSLGDPSLPKEYLEAFANGRVVRLDDFTELTIHAGGKTARRRRPSRTKGRRDSSRRFSTRRAVARSAPIPLDEIEAVTLATLAIEEALRSR